LYIYKDYPNYTNLRIAFCIMNRPLISFIIAIWTNLD